MGLRFLLYAAIFVHQWLSQVSSWRGSESVKGEPVFEGLEADHPAPYSYQRRLRSYPLVRKTRWHFLSHPQVDSSKQAHWEIPGYKPRVVLVHSKQTFWKILRPKNWADHAQPAIREELGVWQMEPFSRQASSNWLREHLLEFHPQLRGRYR